jgi:phosphonate transport system substrate-binding protein
VDITEAQAKTLLPNHYTGFVVAGHESYKMIEDAGVLVGRIKKK